MTLSQFFILHFVWWSLRPLHSSSGGEGGGGEGGSGEGGADGGSASHKPQVFLHCSFSASEYLFLHLFCLHLFCVSAHGGELGDGGEGGGGEGLGGGSEGGSGEGGADGGSASHKPQVFLHCSFSASEYLFLHFFCLHLLCVSAHGGELGDGGEGGNDGGTGGDGGGGGSEGGGGEGATTTRTETVGRSTFSTVTPAARDRKSGNLARACTEATTLAASPTT